MYACMYVPMYHTIMYHDYLLYSELESDSDSSEVDFATRCRTRGGIRGYGGGRLR